MSEAVWILRSLGLIFLLLKGAQKYDDVFKDKLEASIREAVLTKLINLLYDDNIFLYTMRPCNTGNT